MKPIPESPERHNEILYQKGYSKIRLQIMTECGFLLELKAGVCMGGGAFTTWTMFAP